MDCKGEVYGVSCPFLRKPGGPHSLFSFPEMFTFTLDDRHYHILNVSSFLLFFYEVVESDGQIVSVWVTYRTRVI